MNRALANDAAAAIVTVCLAVLAGAHFIPRLGWLGLALAVALFFALACGWAAMRERGR